MAKNRFFVLLIALVIVAVVGLATQVAQASGNCQYGFNVTATNNHSVHEGTRVVVTTNEDSLTLYDVEQYPGKVSSGYVRGNAVISIQVVPGPDGKHSVDIRKDIKVECQDPPKPTPKPTEIPTEIPTEVPTEEPTQEPTEPPVEETPEVTETPIAPPPPVVTEVPDQPEWLACDADPKDVWEFQRAEWEARCKPQQAPPTPEPQPTPAESVVCEEPSVFLRRVSNDEVRVQVLTTDQRQMFSYGTTGHTDLDASLSENGQFVAFARQAEGLLWQIMLAPFEDLASAVAITEPGLNRNPAVSNSGMVAFQVFDREWIVEIRTRDGEFVRSIANATQPFWISDSEFGFVQDGQLKATSLGSTEIRVQTAEVRSVSQPDIMNDITAYVANNVMVVESLEHPALIESGTQPAINRNGAVAYVWDGDLYVFEDGEITHLVDLDVQVENPVWYCGDHTLFVEVNNRIYSVVYFPGRHYTEESQLQLMTGDGFSQHTITRPELQRADWAAEQLSTSVEVLTSAIVALASPTQEQVVDADIIMPLPVTYSEPEKVTTWTPAEGETWSHWLLANGYAQGDLWGPDGVVARYNLNEIPLTVGVPAQIPSDLLTQGT